MATILANGPFAIVFSLSGRPVVRPLQLPIRPLLCRSRPAQVRQRLPSGPLPATVAELLLPPREDLTSSLGESFRIGLFRCPARERSPRFVLQCGASGPSLHQSPHARA